VLDFQVEVVKIEEPLPDGYQFAWTDDAKVPKSEEEAFNLIDEDNDGAVDLPEVCAFFSPCQKKAEIVRYMFVSAKHRGFLTVESQLMCLSNSVVTPPTFPGCHPLFLPSRWFLSPPYPEKLDNNVWVHVDVHTYILINS